MDPRWESPVLSLSLFLSFFHFSPEMANQFKVTKLKLAERFAYNRMLNLCRNGFSSAKSEKVNVGKIRSTMKKRQRGEAGGRECEARFKSFPTVCVCVCYFGRKPFL